MFNADRRMTVNWGKAEFKIYFFALFIRSVHVAVVDIFYVIS